MDKKTRHAVLLAALFALTPDSRAATAIELAQQHNEQAIALHRQGDFAGAIRHYREALPAIVEYFGEGSVERVRVLNSLADAQLAAAQYRDAEQSYMRLLETVDASQAPLMQADALNGRASALYMRRRYRQAEPLFLKALAIIESQQPLDSARALLVLDNLNAVYQSLHNAAKTELYSRRALRLRQGSE